MAAALRGRPGTRCLTKCITFSNINRIRESITAYRTAYSVGYWVFSSSSYHTGISCQGSKLIHSGGSQRLLAQQFTGVQFPSSLSRPIHRHNSSVSSIFNKIYFVNAASPSLNEEIIDPAANIVGETLSQSSAEHSLPEASTSHSDTAAVYSVADPVEIPPVSDAAAVTSIPDAAAVTPVPDAAAETILASQSIESIAYIPPPPVPPEAIAPALNVLGEPTLASVGLGGWGPVGIIQQCLEQLHVTAGLPWWGAIALTTVIIRTLIFPLVLKSQRNAAKMNNNMPQLQILQIKMSEARNSGDQLNAARYGQEMMIFMKEKDISPMKNVIVPLAQAPIFISMFMGLRGMANLPLESFKDGGLFWFTDLTVCDPYYLLPVITSVTMLATIELGTDGAKLSAQNMHLMKYVLRGLPLVIFPFTVNFPAAVLCYWVSTNLFSLIQVGFLKIPKIRNYFQIDQLVTHKKETLPEKKGMVEGFKESWKNMQISREIADRERYDEMRFKKAGSGPLVRTYKHDPTKRVINVQAKMKSK